MIEFNPYAYPVHEDPYPFNARLRAESPVYRNDELDFWALSRHADILAVFRDPKRFSNVNGASLARLEGIVALEEWWHRFPDYHVEGERAARVHSVNVRGFANLPVSL